MATERTKSSLAVLLFIASVAVAQESPTLVPLWRAEANALTQWYGVEVTFDHITFPTYWKDHEPKYDVVQEDQRLAAVRSLGIDLSHYEAAFVHKNLSKVFLYRNLTFQGYVFGGTNDHVNRWLYLNVSWLGDNGQHEKAMGFHKEFASILFKLYRDKFPQKSWRSENPPNFKYAFEAPSEKNIASGRLDLVGNEQLYTMGFVCGYGQLALEDDAVAFAELMIAKPALLEKRGLTHTAVRNKTKLLESFYKELGYRVPDHRN